MSREQSFIGDCHHRALRGSEQTGVSVTITIYIPCLTPIMASVVVGNMMGDLSLDA